MKRLHFFEVKTSNGREYVLHNQQSRTYVRDDSEASRNGYGQGASTATSAATSASARASASAIASASAASPRNTQGKSFVSQRCGFRSKVHRSQHANSRRFLRHDVPRHFQIIQRNRGDAVPASNRRLHTQEWARHLARSRHVLFPKHNHKRADELSSSLYDASVDVVWRVPMVV